MAPDGTATVNQAEARNEVIAKSLEIFSTSTLGLTVGCAQCHNHRYDPISQADYYRLRAIFEPAFDWKKWKTPNARRVSLYTDADRKAAAGFEAEAKKVLAERTKRQNEYIQATFEKELAKLPAEIQPVVRKARETSDKKRTAAQKALLREHPSVNVSAGSLYLYNRKAADELKKMSDRAQAIRGKKPKEQFVRALTESGSLPKTFLFHRGDHQQPQKELDPSALAILQSNAKLTIPQNNPQMTSSGRRLAYARWLTNGQHPMTARVIVNRVWHQHFGRGIVDTPGDFGRLGGRPSHPQLLDWLADEFVHSDWSLKKVHRLILLSRAYRQSSQSHAQGEAVDADNRLLWRMSIRRLEAEALRDATLAVSGQLNTKAGGAPVPVMADRIGRFVIGIENLNAGRPGAVIDMKDEQNRRSLYVQVRRSRPLAVLDTFDAPRMDPNCTQRSSSTVATQALMLMNGDFTRQHAQFLARRLRRITDEPARQIDWAWRIVFSRSPTTAELQSAAGFHRQQQAVFAEQIGALPAKKRAGRDAELEALTSLCHALLSSNEFLYVD